MRSDGFRQPCHARVPGASRDDIRCIISILTVIVPYTDYPVNTGKAKITFATTLLCSLLSASLSQSDLFLIRNNIKVVGMCGR